MNRLLATLDAEVVTLTPCPPSLPRMGGADEEFHASEELRCNGCRWVAQVHTCSTSGSCWMPWPRSGVRCSQSQNRTAHGTILEDLRCDGTVRSSYNFESLEMRESSAAARHCLTRPTKGTAQLCKRPSLTNFWPSRCTLMLGPRPNQS